MDGLVIRLGTPEDADVLARHRCEMFREMGVLGPEGYEQLHPASAAYFKKAIAEGSYLAWVGIVGEAVIAGGGMLLNVIPPRPGPDGRMLRLGPQGLIINVFVEQEWRRQGIAERLMRHMIEHARGSGVATLVLHASNQGRPLYERLGFKPTTEMRLFLSPEESSP